MTVHREFISVRALANLTGVEYGRCSATGDELLHHQRTKLHISRVFDRRSVLCRCNHRSLHTSTCAHQLRLGRDPVVNPPLSLSKLALLSVPCKEVCSNAS